MIDLVIKRGHTVIYTYKVQRTQSYLLTGNDSYIHLCLLQITQTFSIVTRNNSYSCIQSYILNIMTHTVISAYKERRIHLFIPIRNDSVSHLQSIRTIRAVIFWISAEFFSASNFRTESENIQIYWHLGWK